MAVIVQDNPYQSLMRKIGYSVGLEYLLKRVLLLTEMYVDRREISLSAFRELVKVEFGRQRGDEDKAAEHFANFYSALDLLQLTGKSIRPLYKLDALSILRRYFENEQSSFLKSAKVVLLQSILEADGEIFLNALESDFDPNRFKDLIKDTVRTKREAIRNVVKSPAALKKVYSVIAVKTQPQQEHRPFTTSKLTRRTEPLALSLRRTTPLSEKLDTQIEVADDYLRKVPVTRRGWAEDLELFSNGQKTFTGFTLLTTLATKLHFRQDSGCYVFWPYVDELAKLRIDPEMVGSYRLTPWSLLCALAEGVGGTKPAQFDPEADYSSVISLLESFHTLYREGNSAQGAIRNQLPLYVAEPCIVGCCAAQSQDIPPILGIIEAESRQKVRRVNRIIIRGTEGGIVFHAGR